MRIFNPVCQLVTACGSGQAKPVIPAAFVCLG